MHREHLAVIEGKTLNGIEALGEESRFVGVPIAVGIFDQADFVPLNDLHSQSSDIVVGDEQCRGSRS